VTRPATGAAADPTSEPARRFDLGPLFAPRSIALVGASPTNETTRIFRDNLTQIGAATRLHLVNPKYDEIDGLRCHPDLAALPEVPDIAIAAVGPARATEVIRQAAALGVPAGIVPGGGVIEGGEPAARMQAEVAEIAAEAGLALLGPNCMGVIDLHAPSATYYDDLPELRAGGTVGIAQSGSVTNAFMNAGTRIGWSRLVSCGSEVVLDVCDFMAAALDDPVTDSIVLFVEGFKRPERFLALSDRALSMDVPVLAVKVGRSPQAQAASVSHSGSLAGDARASEAAMRAAGVILCRDLDELLETAALVSRARRLGRRVGQGRTAVVTVSTGEASLVADLAPATGLTLPPIPAAAASAISAALPTLTHIANPLDPWGAGDPLATYRTTLGALAGSGAYDVLALVHDFPYGAPMSETELAVALGAELVAATTGRDQVLPVFISLTSGDVPPAIEAAMDDAGGVPILRGAATASTAIAGVARWERDRAHRTADGPRRAAWPALAADVPSYRYDRPGGAAGGTGDAAPEPLRALSERDALRLVAWAGLPTVETFEIPTAPRATMVAAALVAVGMTGWPVAVKVDAVEMAHKSAHGGVVIGVRDRVGLEAAMDAVLKAAPDPRGVLVQPMVGPGVELIVGARRDLQFGPIVLVGIGGVLAEALDDIAVRLAPITDQDALEMLGELRAAAVLDGVGGLDPIDRGPIAALVVSLATAMLEHPHWVAIDLNPVIVRPYLTPVAVDALVVTDVRDPAWDYEDPGGASRH
jgi:acyl-CoA synthetase (NDP forming)